MTRAKSNKRRWEREYPHKIDLPEKPEGRGKELDEIHRWCRENAGDWQCFGGRFYFMDEADTAAFRRYWMAKNV